MEGYPTLKIDSGDSSTESAHSADMEGDLPENAVKIAMLAYSPQSLKVKVGTTVTWINQDPFPHTATAATEIR